MQLTSRRVSIKYAITVTLSSSRVSKKVLQKAAKKGISNLFLRALRTSFVRDIFSIEAALDILKVSADIRSTVKENAEKALSK